MHQTRSENERDAMVKKPAGADEWSMTALSTVTKLSNIIGFLPINLDEILKAVVQATHTLFAPRSCAVYLIRPENRLDVAAWKTEDGRAPDVHYQNATEACSALRDGLPHISCASDECRNRKPGAGTASYVCIPLTTGSDVHGVLSLTLQPEESMSRDRLNVLLSIANQVSASIQRHRLFETLNSEKQEIERAYRSISDLNSLLTRKIDELRMTQDRLIQSEKLAATGELSAGLCHEINNPISIILNRIECLKMEADDLSLSDTVLRDLEVIYNHAAKVSSLVQDLLIFSRHHPVEFQPVNLPALIDRVIGSLHNVLVGSGCRVHVDIPLGVSYTVGDSDRLEQVFRNLLANAVDAMPLGGNIFIKAERCLERGGAMLIHVQDEGEGIPEGDLLRIFDPFFTTKKLGKGSGLGLSICYGIVKSHGGDIRVKSERGRGSTFSVSLPLEEMPRST
ncbi:MAG TPA: ATP-binding protein [Nitrospirota bacterium]|nr:ATP-binding protein [Nitrospirota bacterium]